MPHVDIIGLGADGQAGLKPELIERIHHADFLAGGERHLSHFPSARGMRFILKNNLDNLLIELQTRADEQQCVVLASGDPLFYGIGTSIVALTPRGVDLGHRLAQALGCGEVISIQISARQTLTDLFRAGRPLVCVMALGIVVRILGPLLRDKKVDPPVVVVDETGQFAISVLGGHAGGGNSLTREVAEALGAIAVVTTASEVLGRPAVDLIGRAWGWKIEGEENLTRLAAAVVRGEPVGVYQDAGRRDWCEGFGGWPKNFIPVPSWPPAPAFAALLVISDQSFGRCDRPPAVVYRPPSLVAGVGCRRGVPCAEIEELFQFVCQEHGLSPLCLGMVATISLKAEERGLREFAACHQVALRCFPPEGLAQIAFLPTPSEKVRNKIGVAGVAEPAAMLAANTTSLIVAKIRSERVTIALARREDA
jgi:cobalamin biosynthesis protein CbiG